MSMRYPGGLIAPTPVNQQFPSGVWTGPQSAPYQANNVWGNDSSFKNTTLLLHGDGATTPFIKDASTNNFQLSIAGDTKPNNLTPFITNGYWSNYFGSANFFSSSSNAAFALGTGDFTVEAWVYPDSAYTTYNYVLGVAVTNGLVFYVTGGNLVVRAYNTGDLLSSATIPALNTWTHVAATRSGTTLRIFVNGVQTASTTNSTNFAQGAVYAGNDSTNAAPWYGYISNLRLVKGTAVYTSNFTPSTTPLTAISGTSWLVCQSNRFVDNSSNAFAITTSGSPLVSMQQPFTAPSGTSLYGSGYFDGSGDYLTSPNVAFASNNFTIEGWFYPTTIANLTNFWGMDNGSGSTPKMIMYIDSSGNLTVDMGNAGTTQFPVSASASTYLRANAWNHIAVVRSGTGASQFVLYINGTSVSSGQLGTNISSITAAFNIGYIGEAYGQTFSGYVSNFRIVNGTAVYTGNFTPSISPLTAVTNTSLLTLQTNGPATNNGFLDSSYNSFPVTRNGNATQGSFTPYGANWSNSFAPNSGVQFPYTSALTSWWTQNFTMEMWVFNNTNAASGTNSLALQFAHGIYTAASTYWAFGTNASGQVEFYYYNGGQNRVTSTTTASLGTWNHIAMVYTNSSGNISLYLNGVLVASATKSGTPQNDVTNTVNIGAVQGTYYNGYISNLRVLNGTALYTGTFTPPTAPLTAITNTQLLTCQSNRFVDNSTNNATPTLIGSPSVQRFAPFVPTVQYTPQVFGGSGYFDGSGDYLTLPVNSAFDLRTNACCIESWVYLTSTSAIYMFATSSNVNGQTRPNFYARYDQLQLDYFGNVIIQANVSVPQNAWNHVVFTRASSSGAWRIFLNGVLQAYNATGSQNLLQTGAAQLVNSLNGSTTASGYITDLRVVNGSVPSAYVTSSTTTGTTIFTPPTAPLTVVANTSLLLNYTGAAIFDNSGMNNLETVGNTQVNTSVIKYGTGSMYFDGSGDRLYEPSTQNFNFGTVDFTIELWVNPISQGGHGSSNNDCLVDFRPGSTGVYGTLYIYSSGTGVYWYVNGSNRITGGAILNGVWTHIAVCRASGNTKLFLNGVQSGSTYADTNNYLVAPIMIGEFNDGTGGGNFYGYIDDLRITKGVARYVTNFTPPVARMPNQ